MPLLTHGQLQAFFLVSDDMMDHSITRRGQPCWYRVDGVGLLAINDSFMLEGAIYHLLKKHFRSEPYYVHLLELFHETTFQTEMGQLVDLITAPEDRVDLGQFSLTKCVAVLCCAVWCVVYWGCSFVRQTRVYRAVQDGVL